MNKAKEELQNMKQLKHEYLYICTDGEELSTGHQESDLKMRDTTCHQRFYIIPEEEHQEQNRQEVGRNVTATKHC